MSKSSSSLSNILFPWYVLFFHVTQPRCWRPRWAENIGEAPWLVMVKSADFTRNGDLTAKELGKSAVIPCYTVKNPLYYGKPSSGSFDSSLDIGHLHLAAPSVFQAGSQKSVFSVEMAIWKSVNHGKSIIFWRKKSRILLVPISIYGVS